jgi:hypothetical protein
MRQECRYCGNTRKEGVEWYDEDYCSGKCKRLDGGYIPPAPVAARNSGVKASLEDYYLDYPKNGQKGRKVKRYCRRFEPERLNWGKPMNSPQLKQAGLRTNRQPIPGDFDFIVEPVEEPTDNILKTQEVEVNDA